MTSLPAAVLWDLDGTLIDTEPYWMAGEHELVAEFGGEWTSDDAHSIVGFDLIDAAMVIRERGGVDLPAQEIVSRLIDGVVARLRQHVPWRPGARELLARLRDAGVPCGLVTMSWQPITDAVLHHLPPGTFRTVITGDMVNNGKPHPEPYQRAAAELRVDPLSCVAIEDSPTGVASAEAAGCVVVAVPNMVAVPLAAHRVVLDSLLGVTPEQLGEFVETTPPPELAPAIYGNDAEGPSIDRSRSKALRAPGTAAPDQRWLVAGAAALVLLLAGLSIWWFALRDDGKKTWEPGAFNVHTWVRGNVLDRAIPDLEENYNAFHQISPFWYEVTGDGQIGVNRETNQAQAEEFVRIARDRGVPLIASLFDRTDSGVMAAIIADPARRSAHIQDIATFAAQNRFQGIDLDYEEFAFDADARANWGTIREDFVTFVRELSERLKQDGRILVVTVPPIYDTGTTSASGYWVYDYRGMAPHVDAIRIMAYDYRNTSGEPGPVAPRDWVVRLTEAAIEAVGSPEKLVLGIPMYGYNWVVGTEGTCPSTAERHVSQSLWRIKDLPNRRDTSPITVDPVTGDSRFTYSLVVEDGTTSCTQNRVVHFVDDEEVAARMQLSIDMGLKGVALFAFGYEDEVVFADIARINAELAPDTVPAN